MFGYIKPYIPELKTKEKDAFKSIYCGLCHELGRSFKSVTRLSLSYDFVFVAMMYYAGRNIMPSLVQGRCAVNPLSSISLAESDEGLEYSADLAMIMMYHKIKDNIEDNAGIKKGGWRLAGRVLEADWKKAKSRRPREDAIVHEMIEAQLEVERRKSSSVDAACEPMANCLAQIMKLLFRDDSYERFGYMVGRYIYLCDAVDDLRGDLRKGGYNPFATKHFAEESKRADKEKIFQVLKQGRESLYMTIGEIGTLNNQLEYSYFAPIINNIVEFGMKNSVDEILNKAGIKANESL